MQTGRVVNLSRLKGIIDFLKNNWCLITLTLAFLVGIVLGTFWTRFDTDFAKYSQAFSDSFLEIRTAGKFLKIFTSSLVLNLIFLGLIFVFGASVTGVTLVPVLIFLRGLLFGALAGNIYYEFSLKGIAFNALIIIPPTVLAVIFLISLSRDAIKLSLQVINITLPQSNPKNISLCFNRFWRKNLIMIIPIILSAMLDGWLSVKMMGYFNL